MTAEEHPSAQAVGARNLLEVIASHVANACSELGTAISLCKSHKEVLWEEENVDLRLWSDIYLSFRKTKGICDNLLGRRYSTDKVNKRESQI